MPGRSRRSVYNAEWVREQGVGVVLPNFRRIARVVDELLEPPPTRGLRAATERLHNRAVFEIPDILEGILKQRGGVPRRGWACLPLHAPGAPAFSALRSVGRPPNPHALRSRARRKRARSRAGAKVVRMEVHSGPH